jgi:hypothetical protein
MKDYQDAHGQAMYDYFKGKRFSEVVERDDGNIDASDGIIVLPNGNFVYVVNMFDRSVSVFGQ